MLYCVSGFLYIYASWTVLSFQNLMSSSPTEQGIRGREAVRLSTTLQLCWKVWITRVFAMVPSKMIRISYKLHSGKIKRCKSRDRVRHARKAVTCIRICEVAIDGLWHILDYFSIAYFSILHGCVSLHCLLFCFFSFLFAHLPCSKSSSLFFRKIWPAFDFKCQGRGLQFCLLSPRCACLDKEVQRHAMLDSLSCPPGLNPSERLGSQIVVLIWLIHFWQCYCRPERRLSCLIHVDQLNHVPIRIRNCRERIGLSERSQICQIQVQKEREDVKSRALTEVNFGLLS